METSTWKLVSSTQYALPVVLVVVLVVVVFALGFRSSVEPPSIAYFEQDKKPTTKKSKKQVRTLPWNMYL
jgi:heme/copper-type cytochrome/quinol oxidase subunit 2